MKVHSSELRTLEAGQTGGILPQNLCVTQDHRIQCVSARSLQRRQITRQLVGVFAASAIPANNVVNRTDGSRIQNHTEGHEVIMGQTLAAIYVYNHEISGRLEQSLALRVSVTVQRYGGGIEILKAQGKEYGFHAFMQNAKNTSIKTAFSE